MNNFVLRSYRYEKPKHLKGSSFWVSRFFSLAATVIILLVHGIWLYVAAIQSSFHIGADEGKKQVVSYMADFRSPAISDVQLVRSPVLLSLPTSVGFSGPLLEKASLGPLPVFNEKPTEYFGGPDEPFRVEPYGESLTALKELALEPRLRKTPGQTADPSDSRTTLMRSKEGLSAYWMDQPGAETVRIPAAEGWGEDAWSAVLYICLGANGRVSHALLENPTPNKAVNIKLLRAVRGTSFAVQPDRGCGRLMIRYNPVVSEEKGS